MTITTIEVDVPFSVRDNSGDCEVPAAWFWPLRNIIMLSRMASCYVNSNTTSYNHRGMALLKSVCVFCVSEISNLLVVTKERLPAHQTPMQESQLSFHRILKEEIEQVRLLIFMFFFHVLMVLQFFIMQLWDGCSSKDIICEAL